MKATLPPLAVLLVGLVAVSGSAQDNTPAGTGTVELLVRTPGGEPAANTQVEIVRIGDHGPFDPKAAVVQARTDAAGRTRFSWPEGVYALGARVNGVGYGGTGLFELVTGRTARPHMPALLPFGSIEGVVPKKNLTPGTYLRLDGPGRTEIRADCDDQGRFVLKGVPPGRYWLAPRTPAARLAIRASVFVPPGHRVTSVVFRPEPSTPAWFPGADPGGDGAGRATWASGTVRDEAGTPVPGADVYVVASYHGGIRMYETVRAAKTDATGHWKIEGEKHLSAFSGTVLVHKPGRPPVQVPMTEGTDVALSPQGGLLEVEILAGGVPVPQAGVRLTRTGGVPLSSRAYVGAAREKEREQVEQLLSPTATADAKGVARFDHLTPGLYQIEAAAGGLDGLRQFEFAWAGQPAGSSGTAAGVGVRVGQATRFRLAVYPHHTAVRFQIRHVDGRPPRETRTAISWGSPLVESGVSASVPLSPDGAGGLGVGRAGLWRVELRYRDTPLRFIPLNDPPFYQAAGVVGVSPLLAEAPPVVLTAERVNPGSLIVRLRTGEGKPIRGFVTGDAGVGSTDANGDVRFTGLLAGRHRIEAYAEGAALPALGGGGEAMPDDKDLVGRTAFTQTEVTTSLGQETVAVVRPHAVGYVRGVVRPPAGRRAADYNFTWERTNVTGGWQANYHPGTGEFVAGPYPVGKQTVTLGLEAGDDRPTCASETIEVVADRVARVEFRPPAKPEPDMVVPKPGSGQGWQDGVWNAGLDRPAVGRVFLPDGKTPAYAASVVIFRPGGANPVAHGLTDATGRMHLQGLSVLSPPAIGLEKPVLVATLPGAHGAAVMPLPLRPDGKELRLVLPPAATVRGTVTVGGKSPLRRAGQVRVLAAYEGKGSLDDFLSARGNPGADGAYELAGLTSGTYRVQAVLDDIWLSAAKLVTVKPGTAGPVELDLDVGEPGLPGVIELVDPAGKPRPGLEVTLHRPPGPLTRALWPDKLQADGAGVVQVPPLEAGKHRITIRGVDREWVVPALAANPVERVKGRIVIE
ncbi:MAG: Carboxypeptidase regulatory-like protein [Gemmataceae bacterium]|nr:Carboxypeptidase regulatory-like protein [Gemmataceae bacterium]